MTSPTRGQSAGDLWMVEAIIQPFKLDAVTRALEGVPGFSGVTVTDARGFGMAKVRSDRDAAVAFGVGRTTNANSGMSDFEQKVRLEVAVDGRRVADAVCAAILLAAHTGNLGDGRVFTWPLSRAIRIQTGEEGTAAI